VQGVFEQILLGNHQPMLIDGSSQHVHQSVAGAWLLEKPKDISLVNGIDCGSQVCVSSKNDPHTVGGQFPRVTKNSRPFIPGMRDRGGMTRRSPDLSFQRLSSTGQVERELLQGP
jgi:hypothetical protein